MDGDVESGRLLQIAGSDAALVYMQDTAGIYSFHEGIPTTLARSATRNADRRRHQPRSSSRKSEPIDAQDVSIAHVGKKCTAAVTTSMTTLLFGRYKGELKAGLTDTENSAKRLFSRTGGLYRIQSGPPRVEQYQEQCETGVLSMNTMTLETARKWNAVRSRIGQA